MVVNIWIGLLNTVSCSSIVTAVSVNEFSQLSRFIFLNFDLRIQQIGATNAVGPVVGNKLEEDEQGNMINNDNPANRNELPQQENNVVEQLNNN